MIPTGTLKVPILSLAVNILIHPNLFTDFIAVNFNRSNVDTNGYDSGESEVI